MVDICSLGDSKFALFFSSISSIETWSLFALISSTSDDSHALAKSLVFSEIFRCIFCLYALTSLSALLLKKKLVQIMETSICKFSLGRVSNNVRLKYFNSGSERM